MTPDLRRTRGSLGERVAEHHLTRAGYEIVERNFRTRHGEIDVIAADRTCIVFCEVKTRVAGGRSGPAGALDAIGPGKRRKLRALAAQWLRARPAERRPRRSQLRFDAIGVTLAPGGGVLRIEHVENAF